MSLDTAATADLQALGPGITWSSAIEPLLEQCPELFEVVEFEPQTTWIRTDSADEPFRQNDRVLEHMLSLPGRKLIHSVAAPVGGTSPPDPKQIQLLQQTQAILNSPWVSEHLSFNHTGEFSTGFFLPPTQTPEGVRIATRNIGLLQNAFAVPVAVETGVNYLRPRSDELADGEFVRQVVDVAGCGLILDLHNLYANARNGRQPLEQFIDEIPLDRVWEVHLAGGMEADGFWLDSHSGAIPEELHKLAEKIVLRLPCLRAIVLEVFPTFVPIVGLNVLREQMERLHHLWQLAPRNACHAALSRNRVSSGDESAVAVAEWERSLGHLVIGRPPGRDSLDKALSEEPGVSLVAGLVREFRASLVAQVLPLTSRMLMLSLGVPSYRLLLNDFWLRVPPQMYGLREAEGFAAYLTSLDLKIPYVAEVLAYEQAAAWAMADGKSRVVGFPFEPIPLLRALAEGRLPDVPLQRGNFEIELTGEDIDVESPATPFH